MFMPIRRWLWRTRRASKHRLAIAAGRNGKFAQALDLLRDRSLTREARAVVAGQLRYLEGNKIEQSTYAVLRRNVHRLEKGLIMRPRREVFGLDFIRETVAAYQKLHEYLSRQDTCNNELQWAHDVLREYFDVVNSDVPVIERARTVFDSLPPLHGHRFDGRAAKPFHRMRHHDSGISADAFRKLTTHRRSVRWYLQESVPRAMIDEALESARQAPSACNRQSFVFRIFDDRDLIDKVIQIPLGTKGFGHNVPVLAVIVGQLRAYPLARDRHAIFIDGALAAMSFVLALETQGLASCLINWADQEPQESMMSEILGLEADERVVMLVAFGYPDPDGMVPFSAKRELVTFRTYN